MKHIRASYMPILEACPYSFQYADWENPGGCQSGEAAEFGTMVHKELERLFPTFDESQIHLEDSEAARCVTNGCAMVKTICAELGYKPESTEHKVGWLYGDIHVTGNADLFLDNNEETVVIDYKTTRQPDCYLSPQAQLQAYSSMCLRPGKSVVLWLRDGTYEVFDKPERDLMETLQEISNKPQARPGVACKYCHGRNVCTYRHCAASSALSLIGQSDMSLVALAAAYPKVKLIREMVDKYDEAINEALKQFPEGIETPEGVLKLKEIQKDDIDAIKAWPILENHFTDEEISHFISIGKTKMLQAIQDKAPQRKGVAWQKELMSDLMKAGSVSKTTEYRKSFEVKK